MYCQNNSRSEYTETCVLISAVSAAVIVTLGMITMFVTGILGIFGVLDIPPVGVRVMLVLGTIFIFAAVSTACKVLR